MKVLIDLFFKRFSWCCSCCRGYGIWDVWDVEVTWERLFGGGFSGFLDWLPFCADLFVKMGEKES